ncbi:MAG: hypothetical protein ACYTEQ_23195, partial [Planctomycetota bacterium]
MKVTPYDWQVPHIEHLTEAFTKHPYLLDASDTGTGKTYTSLFVCKNLGITPFIIAPKIVLSPWRRAAKEVGVELLDVVRMSVRRRGRLRTGSGTSRPGLWSYGTRFTMPGAKTPRMHGSFWLYVRRSYRASACRRRWQMIQLVLNHLDTYSASISIPTFGHGASDTVASAIRSQAGTLLCSPSPRRRL